MKHLLQGEERGFWGKEKNKFFKMVLLFSVHSPDPFFFSAYFPDFNLSYSFSFLLPSIFQHVLCLFFQCLIFQTLRSIVSSKSYLLYILFYYFFKASLWILFQRNHDTNYCGWSSDSKSRRIWNEGYGEAVWWVWWLRVHILEAGGFAFEPTHWHLLAMTKGQFIHSLLWAALQADLIKS